MVGEGPNAGLLYFTDVPVQAVIAPHINVTALATGSAFLQLQYAQRRTVDGRIYCSRVEVQAILPMVQAHEGLRRDAPNSHVQIFMDEVDRTVPSTFEALVGTSDMDALSLVSRLRATAAEESRKLDTSDRNPFSLTCYLRYHSGTTPPGRWPSVSTVNSRVMIVSLAAASVLASAAQAQGRSERDSVQLRNACRLAGQILTTGYPDPHYDWALSRIRDCDVSGPLTLGTMWQQATGDSAPLVQLVYQSQRLRDSRLLGAILAVVADGTRPALVRVGAMRTLISYHSPGRDLAFDAPSDNSKPGWCVLGEVTHFSAADGAQPLDASAQGRILDALRGLEVEPGVVGRAARCAVRGLEVEAARGQ